jgi:hypothetical protein
MRGQASSGSTEVKRGQALFEWINGMMDKK